MKKIIMSMVLGIFLVGGIQPVLATEKSPNSQFEAINESSRSTLKPWFKDIPPLRYKGRTRINYYPYNGGYTGVYL